MKVHTLCNTCTVGIANDDWTALDACDSQEDADNTMAIIMGTLEILGWLSLIGPADMPGYWDCALCNETCCSGGTNFATLKSAPWNE